MHVKLMAEYGCEFPLWIDFDEALPSSVDDPALRARIQRWNDVFLSSFHVDSGWLDESVRQQYAAEGEAIFAALKQHFSDSAEVVYNAWPLT
jgi:hypothetical protein